ncbi:hypothetical protein R6Q59_009816 [Mikania micrantha]
MRRNLLDEYGCASGIGLATVQFLLSFGAKIVGGDLNTIPITHDNLTFHSTNVILWADLINLFAVAHSKHGRIDHVFANAGISNRANYLDLQTDSSGQLVEPNTLTYDINLRGVVNASALAFHYMKSQSPLGGSVVVTASASSFQRFSAVDYASAKHGVLGSMRGMVPVLEAAGLPIRINGIAPSWTVTGLVPAGLTEAAGKASQPADVPARSVACLMTDEKRNGHLIYSVDGKFKEVDESIILKVNEQFLDGLDDNVVMANIAETVRKHAEKEK